MPSREDNLEVAKLAKLIGSQLNMIDKFSLERSNVPANRINMDKFIAQVTNPNQSFGNASGYVPEDMVQKMVPDVSHFSKPPELIPNIPQSLPTESKEQVLNVAQPIQQAPQVANSSQEVQNFTQPVQQINTEIILNKEDLSKFLDRIASSVEKLVDYYVSRNIMDSSKKEILND